MVRASTWPTQIGSIVGPKREKSKDIERSGHDHSEEDAARVARARKMSDHSAG